MKQLLLRMIACLLVAGGATPLPTDFKSLKALAEKGDTDAQNELGDRYYHGQGLEKDFKEAVKWYRKAAEQGVADAQTNLGVMYYNGQGVEKDFVTALAWYNIAVTNGDELTKNLKTSIAKKMTPDQIAKAEELVKEMVKNNPKLLK